MNKLDQVGVELIAHDRSRGGVDSFARNMRSVETLTRRASRLLGGLGVGIGTYAIVRGFKSITEAAMAAEESENLFRVSMDQNARAARQWSDEISAALGLNEYQVRKNVSTFNVMFESMGLGAEQAYEMAKGLTRLTYDMASFYNLGTEEAFQKLQAGITGEIEPLKRLGIVVGATAVKQHALTMGLVRQDQELTEAEKILARYSLIMDQTRKAQGDLERTADSATNVQRRLNAQWEKFKVQLGELALGPITAGMEKLVAVVESLNAGLKKVEQTAQEIAAGTPLGGFDEKAVRSMLKALPSPAKMGNLGYDIYGQSADELAADQEYRDRVIASYRRALANRANIEAAIAAQMAAQGRVNTEGAMEGPAAPQAIDWEQQYKTVTEYTRAWGQEVGQAKEAVRRLDEQLDTSIEVTARMADGHQYAADQVAYEHAVWKAYGDDVDTANRLIEQHTEKLKALANEQKKVSSAPLLDWTDVARRGLDDLAGTLTEIVFDFENATQHAERFAEQLARMAVQELIMRPLLQGLTPSRLGNVFGPGGVEHFARGGIVSAPTLFRFAGGTGLMGEAGPEAVVPLARDSRGELGIKAQTATGGRMAAPKVSIQVTNESGGQVAASDVSATMAPDEYIIGLVLRDVEQGGRTRDLLRRRR